MLAGDFNHIKKKDTMFFGANWILLISAYTHKEIAERALNAILFYLSPFYWSFFRVSTIFALPKARLSHCELGDAVVS